MEPSGRACFKSPLLYVTRPDPPCFKSACFKSVPSPSAALSFVTPHYQKRQNFRYGREIPQNHRQGKGLELGQRRGASDRFGRKAAILRPKDRPSLSCCKRGKPASHYQCSRSSETSLATTSSDFMAAKSCTVDGSRRAPSETRSVRNCYTCSDVLAATGLLNDATRASLYRTPVRLA